MTLVTRLSQSYDLTGSGLLWFQSYLCGRTQFVHVTASQYVPLSVPFGVPQCSVLGPILFLLYALPIYFLPLGVICFLLMLMLMTRSFTAPVDLLMFRTLLTTFPGVLTMLLPR